MASNKLTEQVNRLEVSPSLKVNLKYNVELKQTKEGRFGYRILKKTPAVTSGNVEWSGKMNLLEEVYVSSGRGFATRMEASVDASEWIRKYETNPPVSAPVEPAKVDDKSKTEKPDTDSDNEA